MGRDIQAIKFSGEDRRKYRGKVRRSLDVFAWMPREQMFEDSPSSVGQEIELNLVYSVLAPVDVQRQCAGGASPIRPGRPRSGSSTWRSTSRPGATGGALPTWNRDPRRPERVPTPRPARTDTRLVMVGILPTLATTRREQRDDCRRTTGSRVLNEQIFAARGEDMPHLHRRPRAVCLPHTDSITPEAACTSLQLHLQVSPDVFANHWNAAQTDRRGSGRARRQLPVPVRQAVVARDQDHPVRAGHRHPSGRAQGAGRAAEGLVRRALDHLGLRPSS